MVEGHIWCALLATPALAWLAVAADRLLVTLKKLISVEFLEKLRFCQIELVLTEMVEFFFASND